MKLQITHMKAPWPAGAAIGDVVELPSVPAWALGKCAQVGDDAPVTAGMLRTGDALPVIDAAVGTVISAIEAGGALADGVLSVEPDSVEVLIPIDQKAKAKK